MAVLTGKKIGFIGGGRMGEGIFSGILKAGLIPPQDLYVADIREDHLKELQAQYGLNPVNSSTNEGLKQLIDSVDVVFLAVLPQVAPKLLPFINSCLDPEKHYVFSIMGGVLTTTIEESIPETSLVRIRLHTGRSHQIRVQFASRGFPLVGDHKYGSRDAQTAPMLFSCRLSFPWKGERLVFEASPNWAFPFENASRKPEA